MPVAVINSDEKNVSCRDLQSIRVFPLGINLSRYFTLGDVSRNLDRCSEISRLPKSDIACNLRNIAINVLDRIITQFPDMLVIRKTPPEMPGSFAHAYNRGQAVIIEFSKLPGNDIVPVVGWIKANINYSQLLLVYTSNIVTKKLQRSVAISYGSTMGVPEEGTVLDGLLYKDSLTTLEVAGSSTTDDSTDTEEGDETTNTTPSFLGISGRDGVDGQDGQIGYTGSEGDIGYTGSQGDIGYTGSLGAIGYTGSAGAGAASASTTANIVVSEDVTEGDLVNIWNSTGTVKARKASSSLQYQAHGFVLANATASAVALVYFSGINDRVVTAMNIATTQYLTITAGKTGNAAPISAGNIVQEVGLAVASNVLIFGPKTPILLS